MPQAFPAARSTMIGLGTNVMVRYLAQDDPAQWQKATDLFEPQLTVERPGFVSSVAMVQTKGFLTVPTTWHAAEIPAVIERMPQNEVLLLEYEQEAFTAMI